MQIIATRSIWQQPSLVLTPQPLSAPFLAIQQIVRDDSDPNKLWKKKRKRKRKKRGGECIPHPFLETWRALRQDIIFLALEINFQYQ